ncbi:helix-turn-helix domain-containing protein [Nocardioides sp.]|uniref:TetR/AcrR family transcriptional regulator n=1 Tax=Nocardioides sp. TaxID=35761 RepID=UPI002ED8C7D5
MTGSATSLRELKRLETAHRIRDCALVLTDDRGLDGWTMDDLAEAADVSRRTLFNYYPGKVDAVLGATPELPEEVVDAFRAGGPHGDLLDDLAELARVALTVKRPEREEVELGRRVLRTEPRLFGAAHQRFEAVTDEFAELVLEREGAGADPDRAKLLLRLLLAVLDHSLGVFVDDHRDRSLVDVFDEQVGLARDLFHRS